MAQITPPTGIEATTPPAFGPLAQERFRTRVRRVDARETVAELQAFVRCMERRYEYSSEEMTERVRSGQRSARGRYRFGFRGTGNLLSLLAALDSETGTATTTTGGSTKAT